MQKELYLYSPLYDFVSEDCIRSLDEAGDQDVSMRMNCPGGSVLPAYGIAAKMNERSGKTTIKVDGSAMSMGAMLLCFADSVEALDVSTIMIHRASYNSSWDPNADKNATPEEKAFLDKINNDLRAKLSAKIDGKKLKELKGVSIKNLFEDEERIDLFLTGKEAKQIGLVDKINTLTPKELNAFNSKMHAISAHAVPEKTKNPKNKIMDKMNVEAFKAKYPKTYAKVFNAGIVAEKERVEACLVFIDVDAKGVKAAIESGKPLNQKQMSEFALKQNSPEMLKNIAAEAAKVVATGGTDPGKVLTAEEMVLAKFNTDLRSTLKLK